MTCSCKSDEHCYDNWLVGRCDYAEPKRPVFNRRQWTFIVLGCVLVFINTYHWASGRYLEWGWVLPLLWAIWTLISVRGQEFY